MARFQSLSEVGLVLVHEIEAAVGGNPEVRLNVPVEDPASGAPAIRISLMWTTPQPSHRNDLEERNSDGTMAPPPPTLSAWYVVSTHGATPEQNAIGAHDLLGQIIRAFHAQPSFELPIDNMGEGRLHVTQVPVDADLFEKVWVPLQVRQRPWVLFDVGPIQLLRTEQPGPEQPIVHPGGIRLAPIEVLEPPRIERITPAIAGQGGRIRIDAVYSGTPSRVSVGQPSTAPTFIVAPAISPMSAGGPVLATLPITLNDGAYDVTLRGAGDVISRAVTLNVVEATQPSVDAPADLTHSRTVNLVLEGRALGLGAVDVVFWPDAGISAPSDVVTVTGTAAGNTVMIPSAALAPLLNTVYRISARYSAHGFTPYVLLEITP